MVPGNGTLLDPVPHFLLEVKQFQIKAKSINLYF